MLRVARAALGLASIAILTAPVSGQGRGPEIIPQQIAAANGLYRAWVTHIQVDRARGRIAHVALDRGMLMVQTDQATIHVLDAENGRTLWVAHAGRTDHPSTPPAASDDFVATTNGAHLYLFDRADGRLIWEKRLEGVASAGPALASNRVYVPLTSGVLVSYELPSENERLNPLEKALKETPQVYHATGMAESAPVVTKNSIVWGTSAGNVYAVGRDGMIPLYRFRTGAPLSAPLSHHAPMVIAASRDGYIYAIREERGYAIWQFSTGHPVVEQPVAIGDTVYAMPETGGLFKLDAETGAEQWSVGGVFHFVAASPTRLYTVDYLGRLLILDSATGTRLGRISTEALSLKVTNDTTDRIYLGTHTGMIQCLRERGLEEPVQHAPLEEEEPPADAAKAAPATAEGEKAEEGEPAAAGEEPAKGDADGEPAAEPADEAAEPDPFADEAEGEEEAGSEMDEGVDAEEEPPAEEDAG